MDIVAIGRMGTDHRNSNPPDHRISECGTFISVGEDAEGLATNGYEDPASADKLAEVALHLIAVDPSVNLTNIRLTNARQMGFLPMFEASLVADSPFGPEPVSISVRCKAGSEIPVGLEIYDTNHPVLPDWKTDLALLPVGKPRTMTTQGTSSFELASLPSGYFLGQGV